MDSGERLSVLTMLAEGKISVDEAERLLLALGQAAGPAADSTGAAGQAGAGAAPAGHDGTRGLDLEALGAQVRRAGSSLQASEIGRTVSREVGKALGSLQRADWGGLASRIVSQVTEAVTQAVENAAPRVQVEKEQEWSFAGVNLRRLAATVANGRIEVEGGDGEQVSVHAVVRVRARDQAGAAAVAEQVVPRAVEEGDCLRLFVEPDKPPSGSQVSVAYRVLCPRSLRAELRVANGNVRCTRIEGGARLAATNGNVHAEHCRGELDARTVNGNVVARVDELTAAGSFETTNGNVSVDVLGGGGSLTATSQNGNVRLCLPAAASADVEARTTNGTVTTELAMSRVVEQKRNALVGTIGEAAAEMPQLRLRTLNGNIHLGSTQPEEAGR